MVDGSPEKQIDARFDKTPDSLVSYVHDFHGKPAEVAPITPKIGDVAALSAANQAHVLNIYAMNPQQLMAHIDELAAKVARHAPGAGYSESEVAKLIKIG